MELITILIANWKVISGILALILTWNKDKIMQSLNIRQKEAEVKTTERSVDTVYIENSQKLVEIYGKSMDDLNRRHEETIADIKDRHAEDLREIIDAKTDKESVLEKTVNNLKTEVNKLRNLVEKLTKQVEFYRTHSNKKDLPDNLK